MSKVYYIGNPLADSTWLQWTEESVGKIDDANRKLAVRAVHASMGERATLTLAQFSELTAVWEVIPIIDGQEVIGAALRCGAELHIGMTRTPRASVRWLIRDVLQTTIRFYGRAYTRVAADHAQGLRFCRRLGFKITGDRPNPDGTWNMVCFEAAHARRSTA